MTTIAKSIPRGDFLLHRGADEQVAARWSQDASDGLGYQPVDLSEWSAELVITQDGDAIATYPCTCTSDGYAIASIAGAETERLAAWRAGEWKIFAYGPSGERELLGWGYFEIA